MSSNISDPADIPSAGRLGRGLKLGWAIGEFAIASHMAIVSIFLLFYLTNVHHIPAALAGTLILIPRLWNIVTDPLMGAVSDRVRSRWGRRRPFLLFGSLLWGISFAAMFWIPVAWSTGEKAAWFLVAYMVVNTALSLYHVPYSAMAAEMSRDNRERVSLVGMKEIAARLSVLASVMASPLIVEAAPDAVTGHRWVGMIAGTLITLSGLVAFFSTAGAPSGTVDAKPFDWKATIRTLATNRPLAFLAGAYLVSSAIDAFYSAMLIYLLTISLGYSASVMGILYPVGSLTAVLMTPLWARLALRMGKRPAYILAFVSISAALASSLLLRDPPFWMLIGLMMCVGASMAGVFLMPSTMVPDTIDQDEKTSGTRRDGTIYGVWIFVQQTGMAFGAFLVGIYLDVIGYRPGADPVASDTGEFLRFGFAAGPALLALCGILLVLGYRLAPAANGDKA